MDARFDRPAPTDDAHNEQQQVERHEAQPRVLDGEVSTDALLDARVLPVQQLARHAAADDHAGADGEVAQSQYRLRQVRVDARKSRGDGRRDGVVDCVDDAGEGE